MKKLTRGAVVGGAFLLPILAFAQVTPGQVQLFTWINGLKQVINALIPIAIAIIFLMIIWNAYKLVVSDGEEKGEVRDQLIKMIIVFFVVLSIYGIVYFIGRTLGIGQGGTAAIPCVTGQYINGQCQ